MADLYILASPTPTLYVYPSQTHPAAETPTVIGGPIWESRPIAQHRRDEAPDLMLAKVI